MPQVSSIGIRAGTLNYFYLINTACATIWLAWDAIVHFDVEVSYPRCVSDVLSELISLFRSIVFGSTHCVIS